jgi:hypothetical protein
MDMILRRLLSKIEALMVAAAFAEEGEAETARRIAAEAGTDDAGHHEESAPVLDPGRRVRLAKSS